jgi:hypothetical protein
MVTLDEQRSGTLFWLNSKHLFTCGNHLLGVIPGHHAQAAVLITEETTAQMEGDRSSDLQLEVALVHKGVSNFLWSLGGNGKIINVGSCVLACAPVVAQPDLRAQQLPDLKRRSKPRGLSGDKARTQGDTQDNEEGSRGKNSLLAQLQRLQCGPQSSKQSVLKARSNQA